MKEINHRILWSLHTDALVNGGFPIVVQESQTNSISQPEEIRDLYRQVSNFDVTILLSHVEGGGGCSP